MEPQPTSTIPADVRRTDPPFTIAACAIGRCPIRFRMVGLGVGTGGHGFGPDRRHGIEPTRRPSDRY